MIGRARVVAVTVTYGDRADLCVKTVRAAIVAGSDSAIVVLNGVTGNVASEITQALSALRVSFVTLDRNEGSAGGFAAGIRAGSEDASADLLWLLDDDNIADPDALRALLDARDRVVGSGPGAVDPVMLSYRPEDGPESRMRAGGDPDAVYGPPGSFLYFDVFSRARRRGARPADVEAAPVPYGPYGGLLVSRLAARTIPGPRIEFHLYEDDSEYTWRLASDRGLHLVYGSVVRDADGKWSGSQEDGTGPGRLLRAADRRRRWFSVRNRIAFDVARVRADGGALRFAVNGGAYLVVLTAIALGGRRPRDLRDVLRAAAAGLALGRRIRDPSRS